MSAVSLNIAEIQQHALPLANTILHLAGNGVIKGLVGMGMAGGIMAAGQAINVIGGLVSDKKEHLYIGQQMMLKGNNEQVLTGGMNNGAKAVAEGFSMVKNHIQSRIEAIRHNPEHHQDNANKFK